MNYKGTIDFIVENHFLNEGNTARELISQLIYEEYKKEHNNGSK